MPNIDAPPTDNVRDNFLRNDADYVEEVISAGLKRHEAKYLQRKYRFEEIQYAAHAAFDNPWRRNRFLLRNFWKAQRKAAIQVGAHITVAILTMIFLLG